MNKEELLNKIEVLKQNISFINFRIQSRYGDEEDYEDLEEGEISDEVLIDDLYNELYEYEEILKNM